MKFKDKNVYDDILIKYGFKHQILKAIEETTELNDVLVKYLTKGKLKHSEVVSEMVDVYITLQQLQIMFGVTDEELQKVANKKFERLGY